MATVGTFSLLIALFYVYGRVFAWLAGNIGLNQSRSIVFQLLCGFFVFNTLLFALAIASPLSCFANVVALATCGILLLVVVVSRPGADTSQSNVSEADAICVLISGIGATLWSLGVLVDPLVRNGDTTIFRIWPDVFFHARQISAFAHAHGISTLSNYVASGSPPHVYHYAIYQTPAALLAMTGIGAYEIFAGFVIPFGVMLTGMAAYVFVASLFGKWPGVAATFAVAVLPDAYYQGFTNKLLSTTFLQLVNVGGLYGVALAAVAWTFMIDGCRRGRYLSVLSAYVIALIVAIYKMQIFVALAFPIMIYPCLFFRGLSNRAKALMGATFVALFVGVIAISQEYEGVPTLRLDGTGLLPYAEILFRTYEPGTLKSELGSALLQWETRAVETPTKLRIVLAAVIVISTFGLWLPALLCSMWILRSRVAPAVLWFPLVTVAVYVVMSTGMAMDESNTGSPEEFLNRPLVWATFVVSAWTLGALYFALWNQGLPRKRAGRVVITTIAVIGFAVPAVYSAEVQTMPAWPYFRTFESYGSVPTCLVDASRFIRANSSQSEIVQDSSGDSGLLVSALSERQAYAIRRPENLGQAAVAGLPERMRALAAFETMTSASLVRMFAGYEGIDWYVLHPESMVSWPSEIVDNPTFACEGYRVYRFRRGH